MLAITVFAFGLMIFSVIPWSSILGGTTGPADYYATTRGRRRVQPYWFELNWWFPQLAMLFILASVLVGIVAKMGEKETVRLIAAGASDMMGPALVVLLAGGVSVIMNNTQTLDTILNSMEQLVSGASAGVFAFITILVNIPLAFLIPSSSGHAALAMPLLAPLADFAEREPLHHDHRLDHGPRAHPARLAHQRRGRRRAGDRQGRLRQVPAVRLAADAGHVRRGDGHNCGGRDPQVIGMAASVAANLSRPPSYPVTERRLLRGLGMVAACTGLFEYNLVIWIERYRHCAWWPVCLNRACFNDRDGDVTD